ncbi:MAG: hypothetical protein ACU0B9_07335 [Limimaricola soesokkakensis]|uniref:hypothetical protein n=1 Tax=Limimaricola soesokkakensis TaxID=1343159 RepID=UPI0040594F2A
MADLIIAGVGLPPASVRGVTQTLQPIAATQQMVRTVNGALRDLSAPQFRKFASQVRCSDQDPPALNGVWPGAIVTVDCIAELSFLTASGVPERPMVDSRVEGAWTIYRPRLTMMVVSFDIDRDEWQAAVGWSLDLEEV